MKKVLMTVYLLSLSLYTMGDYRALVIATVADMAYEPLAGYAESAEQAYARLPYAEATEQEWCERGYQLLFNEVVDIIAECGEEALVSVPHIFYKRNRTSLPQTYYWTLKKNIISFKQLEARGLDTTCIPTPIRVGVPDLCACNEGTIALLLPFYDHVTEKTYSVGTRFKYVDRDDQGYHVDIIDVDNNKIIRTIIPCEIATRYQESDPKERIQDFVHLIRTWAHVPGGVIPYVWGGSSFTHVVAKDTFSIKKMVKMNGQEVDVFVLEGMNTIPHTGFDCSCMISRAAQLCGIPYYLGDSATIAYVLPGIKLDEPVKEGDIIWLPGHVIVVASLENNTIIESRGYGSGFGRVHEMPLHKLFKGVDTFDQLKQIYHDKRPLELLNSEGGVRSVLSEFKICALRYVWQLYRINFACQEE